MSALPPLNTKRDLRCPKCNGNKIGMRYCERPNPYQIKVWSDPPCPFEPHMHRDCERCKYLWLEQPYAKKPRRK